jgi:hypothetical protein
MGKSAARRSSPPTEPPPPSDHAREDPAADAAIAATREQLTKPPKTTIHRVDPDTGDAKFCGTVLTELATEEYIARKFGAGKFRLTHRKVGEAGSYVYAGADTAEIDPSAVAQLEPETVDDAPAAGASSPAIPTGGDILERAMEAGVLRLLEQSARQNDLTIAMIERLRNDSGKSIDFVALIVALAPIVKELLASRKDPTETAIAIATLLSKRDTAADPDKLTSMFERGLNLARKFNDNGSSSDSIMPIVGKGVEVLGGIVEAVNAERRAARGAEPTAANPPLALVPPNSEDVDQVATSSSEPDRPWISAARPHLPTLIAAARFMPAGAAAETIAANLTGRAFEDLIADIDDTNAPGFAGRLVAVFPAAANLSPVWFENLLRELIEMAGPAEEETPPAARAGAKS